MTEYEKNKNAINNLLKSEIREQNIELAILAKYMALLKEKQKISQRIIVIKTELTEIHKKMSETRFFSYNKNKEVTLLHDLNEEGYDLSDDEDNYIHYDLKNLVKKISQPATIYFPDEDGKPISFKR